METEYVIGRLEPGPPPWTEPTGLMSVLQMLQTDPTDCQSVLVEIQIDPTDFHVVLSLSLPGADRDSRSVLWVRREIVQIAGVPHDSCLTYSFGGWHIANFH